MKMIDQLKTMLYMKQRQPLPFSVPSSWDATREKALEAARSGGNYDFTIPRREGGTYSFQILGGWPTIQARDSRGLPPAGWEFPNNTKHFFDMLPSATAEAKSSAKDPKYTYAPDLQTARLIIELSKIYKDLEMKKIRGK